jgi:hypothetical protein
MIIPKEAEKITTKKTGILRFLVAIHHRKVCNRYDTKWEALSIPARSKRLMDET